MTDWEFLAMQNSTSVRSPQPPLAARLLRPGVAMLSALAPALAARVAERLFLTAPRYPAPAHETSVLAGARRTIVHVDGAPVTTWTWGHGPRVLLVHGWGGRGAQLASFVGPLVASGCSVVTFDAPGHGTSPQARSSIVAFLAAIRAIDRTLGPARELMQARIERQLGVPWSALDVRTYAPDMRTPLLVVHDRDDAEVPWQDGAIIARGWPGAVLSTTGGLGHRRILRDPYVVRAA